ncbi:Asp23/Gls24 family envelope stress response protein [Mycolicibacterium hippocampi]|uniref:Alkaline shock protein 23 n=1 Tax=Mycolicibacterium hippocampi TaxID=659824 RepID=A0A850PYP9_9MYCO|nr:Asp23/Gls24 family envelope stress response protein [Mycolicibacterium hippocampi]NVN52805.1 Alkaline shock protein 23 [Mycolicibacterium hippocampi]
MTSTQPASTAIAKDGTGRGEPALLTSQGKTTIADTVVSKIAGIAAKEVHGVYSLGGGASRVVGALRERIPGASVNHSQGVSVEVGEKQTAVDLDIVADYGVSITDLAEGLRRNVIAAIERMTGLEVTEVNVTVHDVHLEDDEDTSEQPAPARVQ